MSIRRTDKTAQFRVQGSDNDMNLRWKVMTGSSENDSVVLNKKYLGGWGQMNLGQGTDTVTVAVEGDWTLLMLGVDSISASQDATTLTVISDAIFTTDGSFTSYTAGYGVQEITFTGLVRDTEISLGDSEDSVFFSNESTSWRYRVEDDGTVNVYDLNNGFKVTLNNVNIENLNIEAGEDPDEEEVSVQLTDLEPDDEGGTSIAVTVPEPSVDDPDPIIFGSTTISFTPQLGGFAQAYGYLRNQDGSVTTNPVDGFYYGYHNYMQMLGYAQLSRGVTSTINLNGEDKYFMSPFYNIGNDGDRSNPLAYRTAADRAFDGWLSAYLQDSDGNFIFSVGTTRIVMGSDDSEAGDVTGRVLNQSTADSNTGNAFFGAYYDVRGEAGYAMYGWGGNDSVLGGAGKDTIWGGTGSDTLVGGAGEDRLFGEAGNDVFAFATGDSAVVAVGTVGGGDDTGSDQVRDFAAGDSVRITVTSADTTWDMSHIVVGTADASSTAAGSAASFLGSTLLVQAGNPADPDDAFEIAVRLTSDGTATSTGSTAAFANAAAARAVTAVNLTGTTGHDNLTTGVNADTVLGLAGNDVINGGGGADSLDGGAGDDSFTFANIAELTSAATVIGGDDSDTITVTAQITAAVNLGTEANIATVESLVLTGGSTAAVTLDTAMTSVTLGAAGSVVLTAAGQDVTGSAGADNVNTGSLLNFAGTTLSLGADTDILTVSTNNTNLSGINGGLATTAETLVVSGLANTTMTAAQHAGFTTITATGTNAVNITDAGAVTAAAAVETYNIVGASNITVAAATAVTGEDGTDQTVTVGGLTVTGTYALGTGTDVIVATTGANIAGVNAGAATTAENLTLTGGITMTRAQHAALTITAAGGGDSVTLTDAGAVTAAAAVETYVLANGANTFTSGTAVNNVVGGNGIDTIIYNAVATEGGDTITNFRTAANGAGFVGGADVLQFSSAGLQVVAGFAVYTGGGGPALDTDGLGGADVELVVAAGPVASAAEAAFLFDTATGVLSFDADGTGVGAAIVIATLTGVADLAAVDFTFVA